MSKVKCEMVELDFAASVQKLDQGQQSEVVGAYTQIIDGTVTLFHL